MQCLKMFGRRTCLVARVALESGIIYDRPTVARVLCRCDSAAMRRLQRCMPRPLRAHKPSTLLRLHHRQLRLQRHLNGSRYHGHLGCQCESAGAAVPAGGGGGGRERRALQRGVHAAAAHCRHLRGGAGCQRARGAAAGKARLQGGICCCSGWVQGFLAASVAERVGRERGEPAPGKMLLQGGL